MFHVKQKALFRQGHEARSRNDKVAPVNHNLSGCFNLTLMHNRCIFMEMGTGLDIGENLPEREPRILCFVAAVTDIPVELG